ncbi:M14 family zinc carboxypeptidase [Bacillaceae bacterium S4-13-58]
MKKHIIFLLVILLLIHPSTFFAEKIVQTDDIYTYENLQSDLEKLDEEYGPLVEVYSVESTKYGRTIYLVKLGFGEANVFYNGSHHAREWFSTMLTMNMIEEYAKAYDDESEIDRYDIRELFNQTSIWFVPMVNPDGVTLQQLGLKAFPEQDHEQLLEMNGGSYDFTRWKANAEGIDLNRQYPTGWEESYTTEGPSWSNYKGTKPFETIETQIMRNLTTIIQPEISIAYHTSGQIVYWNLNMSPEHKKRDTRIAETYQQLSGYTLMQVGYGAGYTDWVIEELDLPALTPELGSYQGEKHVDPGEFSEEWERNRKAGLFIAAEGYRLHEKNNSSLAVNRNSPVIDPGDLLPGKGVERFQYVSMIKEKYKLPTNQAIDLYLQKTSPAEALGLR